MKNSVLIFIRGVNRLNYYLGKALRWIIWLLMGLFLFEVVSRYVFNVPHAWSLEIAANIFGFYFLLGAGYILLIEGHVRMDALYSRWSPRGRAIADAATFLLPAVYLVVLIWRSFIHTKTAMELGECTNTAAATPVAPIRAFIMVGAVILLLQALAFFIQDLYFAISGKTLK